jgi:TrmH family RNA methyltransferase
MPSIAVALVEPRYYVNVGHVARLMKNFGLQRMYFVKPAFDRKDAVRYSTHGKHVLAAAKTVTLGHLRKKFDVLIGTTAVGANSRLNVLRESISANDLARIVNEGDRKRFCIILGRESSGLKNRELAICDLVCVIDTKTSYRTMNVAHALAIILYEISKLKPQMSRGHSKKMVNLASQYEINLVLKYLVRLAKAGKYDDHKKPLLEAAVKKIMAMSNPTAKDAMLLVSLFRKSLLAIERGKRNK